jgi:NADP-dependent 3-hydroxy acid dehydrogenase YdfG
MQALREAALVTGASSGIGRAIAVALAEECRTVCLVGRRQEMLASVAECVRSRGAEPRCLLADLGCDTEIAALVARLCREEVSLEILVHAAGTYQAGPVDSSPVEDFDAQYRTNLRGPFLLTQALLPILRRTCGEVVFVNSSVVSRPKANVSQYAVTKHGLKALADTLREEVNADGIRVLSLFPGRTATPMQEEILRREGASPKLAAFIQPEDLAAIVLAAIRLPRSAEVTDIHIRPMKKS